MASNTATTPTVLSVAEAAEFTKVSRSTICRLMQEGTLPYVKLRGRTLIRVADLEALLELFLSGATNE